ncbi:hypothetical protein Tco_1121569 [Tanacetum coccineum]|uniref:Uncharacterized protein n=1 Tax=Tanacetum coccineum TaxID=301880 RepID=A0ABQ5IY20_9ASTR
MLRRQTRCHILDSQKIIIDYFMSKDQSISRRNKMFWHTARDDTMFTSMRCISRHEDTQMKEAVDVAVQLQTNKLREEAQAENQEFLNRVDSTIKAIIKEQVQTQVSKIMPKIKKYVKAEVLVRSTNQPQTSYVVAASLSELELKKILIDKMETNKSIDRSDTQKNLYNALAESYNTDKDIIASYADVVTLKRGRDDQDKDEDPFAGSNRGSKRRRSGKEAESSKEPKDKDLKSISSSKGASKSQSKSSSKSAHSEEHDQKATDLEDQPHQDFNTGNKDDSPAREALHEDVWHKNPSRPPTPDHEWHKTKTFLATPIDFSAFIMHRIKIDNLTQEVLTGPTYDLIKGTCKSVVELEYHLEKVFKATNDRLDWHNPERKPYPHDLSKPLPLILNEHGRQVIPLDHFINNDFEYLKGGCSSQKYTTSITKMKSADYGQVKWIKDKTYYDSRTCGRSTIGSRKLPEEDQPQKSRHIRLNLRRMTAYTAYYDIQGIIYVDELNINRLMRTNELHKFSDGTLNHVRTALNDTDRGIEMDYLPKRKWSKQDKKIACVMINAINKKLRDRRLLRSLEKFIGGREYGNDLRLLERTI